MEDPVDIVSSENEAPVCVELVRALFGNAQETHDITSLDIAIELVGELVVHDERNLGFLNHLLDMREDLKGVAEYDLNLVTDLKSLKANLSLIILGGSSTSNTAGPGDPISLNLRWSTSSAQQRETAEIIDNSFRQFCATGGINHWENAIGLAEVLALSNKKNEKPLNQLLDIRQTVNSKLKSRGKANPEGEKTQETAGADYSSGRSNQEAKPHTDPMTAFQVARLMETYYNKFIDTGEIKYLENAIPLAEMLMGSTRLTEMDPCYVNILLKVARANQGGTFEQLGEEINRLKTTLAETHPGDPDRMAPLGNICALYLTRYKRSGRMEDLEQLIKHSEAALAATPPENNDRAWRLDNLIAVLSERHARSGAVEDIERAIRCSEEALVVKPSGSKRVKGFMNLGASLLARYKRLGAAEDLEEAIKHAELAASTENSDQVTRFGILITTLFERYKRFGAVEDLEQAIKYVEVALAATPPEHINRAMWLSNLSTKVHDRYKRFGVVEDLEQAIKHSEAALAATPPEYINRAMWLNILGNLLSERYEISGAVEDFEQAMEYSEAALAATPPEHIDRAQWLNSLSNHLCSRYNRFGAVEDLEQAIKHSEAALAAKPPETAVHADMLENLVTKLVIRYVRTNSLLEFYRIIHMLYLLWHSRTWPLLKRISMAYIASELFALKKMWQDSSSILADAVKLLPQVSSRGIGRKDQEYRLSRSLLTQLASTAVSVAFQAGEDASYCLRLFELGRGVIMGLVIDCRSDLSELQEKHPAMFEKFHSLRIEIDSPPAEINPNALLSIHGPTYEQVRDRRQLVADQLEEMLVSIRELPGFEGFQLPPHAHYLMSMAIDGPIVIFNSTCIRSDAIIVTSSGIKELRLEKLIFEEVKERMDEMRNLTNGPRSTYGDRNSRMLKMLQWLWDVAVEPVCEALHLDPVADGTEFPRVWWIGTGPLSMAPFHAAGNPKSKNNTMSRAISSYIPTIKALSYARQKNLEFLGKKDSSILLVTMPTTPGRQWSPLPGVVREAKNIADLAEGKVLTTQLEHPSAARVLAELPSHDAIHFACHGKSDSKSPSDSALQLQPENESEEPDRLTVEAISNMKIQRAQIAYLSACCTAENASEDLADESIYIASGFQLAGFSHVLATQWVSMDRACLQVSGEFYRLLFDGQPCRSKGGHRKVSSSFHFAVKKLRDANLRQPIMWASFIHTGA